VSSVHQLAVLDYHEWNKLGHVRICTYRDNPPLR
jgi:hypothetical protein